MPFEILPVEEADLPRLISVQNAAFACNPIDNAMFPTRPTAKDDLVSNTSIENTKDVNENQKNQDAEQTKDKPKEEDTVSTIEHQIAQLRKEMTTNKASRYIKCVDDNQIISWAKLEVYPLPRPEVEWTKETALEVEPGANRKYTEAFVRGLDEWKQKLFRGDPFCCKFIPFLSCFFSCIMCIRRVQSK